MLFGVAARELVRRTRRGFLTLVPLGLAARRVGGRGEAQIDGARLVRVARERRLRVRHLARVGEDAHLAVVGDVVLLVGRHHLEAQAAGVVGVMAVDVAVA